MDIKSYFSLVKFSHTIFAMPFALIGFWYGVSTTNTLSFKLLLLVLGCMIAARNCAMAFNRYADRKIDALNERTAQREIPSGVISEKNSVIFIAINAIIFVIFAFFINSLAFYLSPIALLVVMGYSLMKRISSLCHLVLGFALSIAPVGAYIAATGSFALFPLLVAVAVTFWTAGFDILYALQDEEFDRSHSLHSIPQYFGIKNSLIISALMHLVTIAMLFVVGVMFLPTTLYFVGASIFSALLIYEHIVVKPNDISRVNLAFATMNGLGSLVYGLVTILAITLYFGVPQLGF